MGDQLRDALQAARRKAADAGAPSRVEPGTDARAAAPARQAMDSGVPPVSGKGHASWPDGGAPKPVGPVRAATGGLRREASRQGPRGHPPVEAKLRRQTAAPQRPALELVMEGRFHPHPLFVEDAGGGRALRIFDNAGMRPNLVGDGIPDNETDLIIGLDFGTSSTKVIIRDAQSAAAVLPVRLDPNAEGSAACLLPSRVFRTGNTYSLLTGQRQIRDLKLALLNAPADARDGAFDDCCAFLALVIRHSRGWLFTEHRRTYQRHLLNWRLNLGLAARSYQDTALVGLFRELAWAAANLAADPEAQVITAGRVAHWRGRAGEAFRHARAEPIPDVEFQPGDVDAIPEVGAQIQGFMVAARWDWRNRPVIALVDVGAGTVDAAIFHVRSDGDAPATLTFYATRVEPNGVMNLHRERVGWLRGLPPRNLPVEVRNHLDRIDRPTDRLRPLPEHVVDYLPGFSLVGEGATVDKNFQTGRYRRQVAGTLNEAKMGKGLPVSQMKDIPLLLSGGGSRMGLYADIARHINGTRGWGVSVDPMRLPVPKDIAESGWRGEDFDRLSVAYGLSLADQGNRTIGEIVRSVDVPPLEPRAAGIDTDGRFISKDGV